MGATNHEALYLYCFARRKLVNESVDLPPAVGGDRVSVLPYREVVAMVSQVPVDEFTGPEAQAHLSDIDWVGPRAVRHEAVIEAVMQISAVFPARFGTLFSSPDRLLQVMAKHHDEILAFLHRAAGQEEWAVKGYLDRKKAAEALTAQALARDAEQHSESPGTRFLKRQQASSQAEAGIRELTAGVRERLQRGLRQLVTALVARPATAGLPSPGQQETVLNVAILVPRAQLSTVLSTVDGMNAEYESLGLTVQCTGPLPPYSFTPALEGSA